METQEREARSAQVAGRASRQSGYEPVYASRSIGHPGGATVVPTRQLKPYVERALLELAAESGVDPEEGLNGALETLAERMSLTLSITPESIKKRLWEVRNDRARATKAEMADAVLLAIGLRFEDTDVLELPAGMAAARERVEVYLELTGGELSESDIQEMSEDLLEFSRCCIHGPGVEPVEEAADIVAVLEGELVLFDFKTYDTEAAA